MRSWLVGIAVLGVLAAPALALAQRQGGTLRITHRENPPSASIHEEATISTDMPFMGLFNNLVVFDPESRQNRLDRVVPDLATAWRWSDDGRTLSFSLRNGVRWHDGQPFTAADVKCTWDAIIGQRQSGMRKNPRKSWYFDVVSIGTDGDHEVSFHVRDPEPSLMAMLAGGFSPVYPCHVSAQEMRTHPIGTGPFMFGEWRQNELIRLVRNPNYWKPGRPYLDAIEYTIIPNRATSMLAFMSGKTDMTFAAEVSPAILKDIRAQAPSAICETQPTDTQNNLLVNRDKPPFDDARIRRAMMLAMDRRAFVDILGQGEDKIGGTMMPPPEGLWGMPPEMLETLPGYAPDVQKSRAEGQAIMAGLGYGPDKMLSIKVSTRNLSQYRDAAVLLIDQLKHVYIQGELEPLDSAVWYARMARKDYTVGLNVQGIGIDDPDVAFFETFACGSERNYTNYCNPDLEKLFHAQSQMADMEQRRQLVRQIDKALQEDGARPVLSHGWASTCWYPQVKGLRMAVNTIYNHWRFEDVWLDR
jgi:peptide/nickel transport system substrate-binding protein